MIVATPLAVMMDVEGLAGLSQQIAARIQAQAGQDVTIAVTTGGARGAEKNALIARVQAAHGRNLAYINSRAMQLIRAAIPGLFQGAAAARRTAEAIGNAMLISIQENVAAQRNPDGSAFRPLSPNYAAAKRRKFGFVVPVLRASGDLLGGLKVRITGALGGVG